MFYDESFHFHWVLDGPNQKEIDRFSEGPLYYGISTKDDLPHIYYKIGEPGIEKPLIAECSICALMGDEGEIQEFMKPVDAPFILTSIILFDKQTSNVAGLRAVGFSGSLLNEVRAACVRQRERYESAPDVGQAIVRQQMKYPLHEMVKQVTFHKAGPMGAESN